MCDKEKTKKTLEEKHIERIIDNDDSIHRHSYQPTEDTLDDNDPPDGGSGVPEKEED